MKIVYCMFGFFNKGGIERVISNKANYLVLQGHEVHIVTTDQKERPLAFPLNPKVKFHDLEINYSLRPHSSYYSKIHCYLHNSNFHKVRLKKLLEELKADIVISTFENETYLLPKIKDGSKKIVEFHYTYFMFKIRKNRKGILGVFDRYLEWKKLQAMKKYDRLVVLTNEDKANWKGYNNIEVISNAQTFQCKQPSLLENNKVIAVGRYSYEKGFDRLIKAWDIINKEIKGWTLHIIGDGGCREALQNQINELGLNRCVFLDGFKSNMKEEYLDASLFVLSSRYEGFGMVLLEAMSCGVPAVSFDCPCGPKDLITDGENGYLVEDDDIEKLADRIVYLIRHPEKRKEMGTMAYKRSADYSEDKIMKQWMELFNEVLADSKKNS